MNTSIARAARLITLSVFALLLASASALAGAHSGAFPNTTLGIHREQIFDDQVRSRSREAANADVVWGSHWARAPRGVVNSGYMTELTDGSGQGVQWWLRNHPDWLLYTCDRATLAYYPGDAGVPLDISNPAVLDYQWSTEAYPNLRAGYSGIAVDNVTIGDVTNACGHFTAAGAWVNRYGPGGAASFRHDALSWLQVMTHRVHSFSRTATVQFNFSYDFASPWSANLAAARIADLILEERGVTNWGTASRHVASPGEWRTIIRWARQLQLGGTCYTMIGIEPQPSSRMPVAERTWILANYLLVKGRCAYVAVVGSHESPSGLTADYGRIVSYPELRMRIGGALAQPRRHAGGAWTRPYSGGVVAVNPTLTRVAVLLSARERQVLGGPGAPATITLRPQSARILLGPHH
jgi:hypothetical protein